MVRAACGEQRPPILSINQRIIWWRTFEMIMLSGARPGFAGVAVIVAPTRNSSQIPRRELRAARRRGTWVPRAGGIEAPRGSRPPEFCAPSWRRRRSWARSLRAARRGRPALGALGARAASPAWPRPSRPLAQFEPDPHPDSSRLSRARAPSGARSRARARPVSRVRRAARLPASITGRIATRGSPRAPVGRSCSGRYRFSARGFAGLAVPVEPTRAIRARFRAASRAVRRFGYVAASAGGIKEPRAGASGSRVSAPSSIFGWAARAARRGRPCNAVARRAAAAPRRARGLASLAAAVAPARAIRAVRRCGRVARCRRERGTERGSRPAGAFCRSAVVVLGPDHDVGRPGAQAREPTRPTRQT